MSTKLKLKSLHITENYGSKEHPYNCAVSIEGEYSTTDLKLTPEQGDRVVACVADLIVESAREVAEMLTVEAMSQKLITANGDEVSDAD